MNKRACEECGKRYLIERLIIKSTCDGDCFYCRMCSDYNEYLEVKAKELLIKFNITNAMIMKEVKEMESDV